MRQQHSLNLPQRESVAYGLLPDRLLQIESASYNKDMPDNVLGTWRTTVFYMFSFFFFFFFFSLGRFERLAYRVQDGLGYNVLLSFFFFFFFFFYNVFRAGMAQW